MWPHRGTSVVVGSSAVWPAAPRSPSPDAARWYGRWIITGGLAALNLNQRIEGLKVALVSPIEIVDTVATDDRARHTRSGGPDRRRWSRVCLRHRY
ncbi:MAG TPA: hypothetical protein VH482_27120 [Thermomicrobiales bacterium]